MSYRGLKVITRQAIIQSSFKHGLARNSHSIIISQDRGFFFKKAHEPRCDLKNQSIVQKDGSRKSAWIGDQPLYTLCYDGCATTYDAVRRGPKVGGKEMMGKRVMKDGNLVWEWITYEQALETSDYVSRAVRKLGIAVGEKSNIGIYSKNRSEWVLADMGLHNFSNVTVPLYDTISNDDLHYITSLCELPLMFVDMEEKTKLLIRDKSYLPTLKYIVQFDKVSQEALQLARENDFQLFSFDEFVEMGKKEKHLPHVPPKPETLATISFTSGTTGRPKGVMLSHMNLISATLSSDEFEKSTNGGDAYLSYLPLAHIYERLCTLTNFSNGAKIGFFRGDPTLLLEDIQSLDPVSVATVPRVIDKLHKGVMKQVQDKPIKRTILKAAMAYKDCHYRMTGKATRDTWADKYILRKVQALLGSNIKQIIIGAAKSDMSALKFMRTAMGIEVLEGYGQTETSGPTSIQLVGDTRVGTVGPPTANCLIKLVDVPDLGYFADKNEGEILVKGNNVTSGYYKNPEATKAAFTEDGFLRTGDIGRFTPEGSLLIVDRIKNVFKLPQGKFVAPDLIEALYTSSRFVQQIYVHGDLTKPWLVAILVPDPEHLATYAQHKHNITGKSFEELCKMEVLADDALRHLVQLTEGNDRPRYEGVYAVHLTPIAFSVQNDLTTPTMKSKRNKIAAYFKSEIDAMYKKIESSEKSS
uniref:Long-chain-fatty-acid--CoA ligase n=1 Tax=Caenorhabditis japonica TaxID=281687 RepID=A0A8R1HTT4_CAEJA